MRSHLPSCIHPIIVGSFSRTSRLCLPKLGLTREFADCSPMCHPKVNMLLEQTRFPSPMTWDNHPLLSSIFSSLSFNFALSSIVKLCCRDHHSGQQLLFFRSLSIVTPRGLVAKRHLLVNEVCRKRSFWSNGGSTGTSAVVHFLMAHGAIVANTSITFAWIPMNLQVELLRGSASLVELVLLLPRAAM